MAKKTTLAAHQAAQRGGDGSEPVSVSNPLAELAEQMVRERSAVAGPPGEEIAVRLRGLDVLSQVDAQTALGEIKGRVRDAAEAAGLLADYDLISAEAEWIWTHYGDTRRASEATYTVAPDGLVNGYEVHSARVANTSAVARPAAGELPDMPQRPLKVPPDSAFGDDEFSISTALAARARVLAERHEDLDHLRRMSLVYLWKKQGGKSKGRAIFGKTSKPSGLLRHFASADFVIWLAADHCRAAGYDDRQLEALLLHELLHTTVTEPDENTGRGGGPSLRPHDFEGFLAEIEIYGPITAELRLANERFEEFKQASLFDGPTRTDCRGCRMEVQLDADGWCSLCSAPMAATPTTADENEKPEPLSETDAGAGVLIHPDGTPLTAEEIAEQEAAELRDDDYFDDDDDEEEGAMLPGDLAIAADDVRKWGDGRLEAGG